MSDPDRIDETNALAETLRAAIASLDDQIDQRAQRIVAERSAADLTREAMDRVQLIGQAMRREMLQAFPEAAETLGKIPEEAWVASAANTLAAVCDEKYLQVKGGQHG